MSAFGLGQAGRTPPLDFPGVLEPVLINEPAGEHAGINHVGVSRDELDPGAGSGGDAGAMAIVAWRMRWLAGCL